MMSWLQLRFGKSPVSIHHLAFYPRPDDWFDVVVDLEKNHPEPLRLDSIQFRGWVRWLMLSDQPVNFTLVANGNMQVRFGAMTKTDFEAFLARLRDQGTIKVRLALRSGTTRAIRSCKLSREAIDHSITTTWQLRVNAANPAADHSAH